MSWTAISDQASADRLIQGFDWDQSFIREVGVTSPAFITPDGSGIVSPEALASCRVLVSTPNPAQPGLELLFLRTSSFGVALNTDIDPNCVIHY